MREDLLQTVRPDQTYINNFLHSREFDYDSIMIYDSVKTAAMMWGPHRVSGYVMTRKANGQDTGQPFWQGGNADAGNAQLSAGDIARVAQLYQKNDARGQQLKNLPAWSPR